MRFELVCTSCGIRSPFTRQTGCGCGGIRLVEYDMEQVGKTMTKTSVRRRAASMWRYAELLPVRHAAHIVSLGEGWTPLVRLRAAEAALPLSKLWVKREEHNPTGSFKARGMSAAVSVAASFGVRKVAVNSNGNAASALAAYAAYAGMACYAFVPGDCPGPIVEECVHYGAHTYLVDGLIHDAGAIIKDGEQEQGWHHVGTLREPGRTEGKKTMGFELAEQLGWRLPDVIVYPTGGGSGVVGMYRAFVQLRELGLVGGELPRFVCVQEAGCQPLVDALADGAMDGAEQRRAGGVSSTKPSARVSSSPTGMRVPQPHDVGMLTDIVRRTGGTAAAVTVAEIERAQLALGRHGISASPEGGATWAGMLRLCEEGWIRPQDEVVLFNTAHAMKYWPFAYKKPPVVNSYQDWLNVRQAATEE